MRLGRQLSALVLLLGLNTALPLGAEGFGERLGQIEALVNQDAQAAAIQARELLAGAEAAADQTVVAQTQRLLGMSLNILGDNEAALAAYGQALHGFEILGDAKARALVLRHEGVSYFDLGRFDQALERYLAALEIFEQASQPVEAAKTRSNIANVYMQTDRIDQAIEQQRQALTEFEQAKVPIGIAGVSLNLGAALVASAEREGLDQVSRRQMLTEARGYYEKSLSIFRALDIPRGILKVELNLATIATRLGDAGAAVAPLLRARELAARISDRYEESQALIKLVEAHRDLDQTGEALIHADHGIELSRRHDDPVAEETFQRSASELREQLGDYAGALRHARRADDLAQVRGSRDVEARIAELTRRFENQQRDRELLTLRQSKALDQAQLARQRVQRNAAIVIGLLALGVLALMGSRTRLRERSRRELEQAVITDPLTGLLNRRGLRALVGSSAIGSEGYALVMCDIDNFKRINDCHGHDVGDAVLAATARALQAELRPEDSAARWGGEEFLIVLGICGIAHATIVAERLRQAVSACRLEGVPEDVPISISLGVAASTHGQGFDITVRAADQALLQAKREGKNCVVIAASKVRAISQQPRAEAPAAAITAG
jgi:diguanylate cyclase (GGDEF)-like protein